MSHNDVPTDLPTLMLAVAGDELEIRNVLRGATVPRRLFRRGDVVVCREVTKEDILLELPRDGCIRIPHECAQYIQVESLAPSLFPSRPERPKQRKRAGSFKGR
jgi:hypothetical protein